MTKKEADNSNNNKLTTKNEVKKLVIRRLPPTLTKDQFIDIVSPLPEYTYLYYCYGNNSAFASSSSFINSQALFSRAYIVFKNQEDIYSFKERFDNYIFVDSKSNEYACVVEYAPFQRRLDNNQTTKNQIKKDSRCNTIEQDSDYMKFLEALNNPNFQNELQSQNENNNQQQQHLLLSCEAILEDIEQREKLGLTLNSSLLNAPKITTPLIEFLKKKKEEKKAAQKEVFI
jgi:regulator of nonsense transcripts 3